jgi:hypothetical protein
MRDCKAGHDAEKCPERIAYKPKKKQMYLYWNDDIWG